MEPQAYKLVSTHAHQISGWTILSRLLHSRATHLGGMNGDVQSDLTTLDFKNREQLEYFHGRILRIQQEIMLFGENFSPTRLLLQYMMALSKSNKLRYFIGPKITDIITFLDNNIKSAVYTGGDINATYRYLDMIGDPKTSNTSGQRSNHLSPSSSINNYAATL